ncbi:hypothetical protein LTR78_000660 [Recurvomyces mirabilis]|uniref:Uncharacterized protein n=1 Tax=Recurvomyces mirabilis TaxID=574656 RepID=A0AAE1C6T3_9PEZI|nr:hypothetical protein LTR78_000660 [Recurvomyces mirabilis]KAK5162314.1 hypothetical protein LTS14_000661 [Recurvomyces mirabilis]
MPHKHTRKTGTRNDSDFNLAPTSQAKPLPAFAGVTKWEKKGVKGVKGKGQNGKKVPEKKAKRKSTATSTYKEDDTPRAFARLMQFHTTGKRPSGLDDNREADRKAANKKRKIQQRDTEAAVEPALAKETQPTPSIPTIQPGEKLSDYAARVDQALPVSGLERKGKGVQIEGMKDRQTKTEKRLQKMYAEWRKDEARLKEKEEERQEEEEDKEEERRAVFGEDYDGGGNGRKRKVVGEVPGATGGGGGGGGAAGGNEDDPWAVLKKKRKVAEAAAEAEAKEKEQVEAQQHVRKKKGLKGVHDVVLAPPTLKVVPKEKFKVRDGAAVDIANVPAKAGSLKRREELSGARRDVIERYRAMMKEGRSGR